MITICEELLLFLVGLIFFLLLVYVLLLHQIAIKIQKTRTQDVGSLPAQDLSLLERKTLLQISLMEDSIEKFQTLDP